VTAGERRILDDRDGHVGYAEDLLWKRAGHEQPGG
jgi:hypothetical protein